MGLESGSVERIGDINFLGVTGGEGKTHRGVAETRRPDAEKNRRRDLGLGYGSDYRLG